MMFDVYDSIYGYFALYDWSYFLFWARIIAGTISAALLSVIGVTVKRLMFYNQPPKIAAGERIILVKPTKEPWLAILKKLESDNPSDWNTAIIQADAIVDTILKEMGLSGETMGERMKALDRSRLSALDELWEAHRIRNEIVHSPEKTITKHRAVYALSLFESVLKELGYIEE